MNFASVIVLIIIGVLFVAALLHIVRHGTCSCGKDGKCDGNCAGCGCRSCKGK